jgi:hypothetical protein
MYVYDEKKKQKQKQKVNLRPSRVETKPPIHR